MAFTYGYYSLALSRSNVNDAAMITSSSVSSALRARQLSKFDVRSAGSQLLGSDPMLLLKLGARRQYSPAKLSISRRVNLTTCSAVTGEGEEESSVQSSADQTRVPDESVTQLLDVVSKSLQPYLQLARVEKRWTFSPMTFFWPFYWGVALATENGSLPDWRIFTLLTVAAAVLRSAACTVNDLCDKDFDGKTPAVLGLAINWGVFLGWAAVKGPMALGPPTLPPALVFFAAWCWTLVYETIYSHQDIKDDRDVGIKSMAILLGSDTKLWLAGFGVAFVAILGIVGHITTLGWPFFVGVAASAIHVVWQITFVDINNPTDCIAKFHSNIWVGPFIFGGIVCGKLLA